MVQALLNYHAPCLLSAPSLLPSLVPVRLAPRPTRLLPCSRSLYRTSLSLRLRLLTSTLVRLEAQRSPLLQLEASLVRLLSTRSSHQPLVLLLTVLQV